MNSMASCTHAGCHPSTRKRLRSDGRNHSRSVSDSSTPAQRALIRLATSGPPAAPCKTSPTTDQQAPIEALSPPTSNSTESAETSAATRVHEPQTTSPSVPHILVQTSSSSSLSNSSQLPLASPRLTAQSISQDESMVQSRTSAGHEITNPADDSEQSGSLTKLLSSGQLSASLQASRPQQRDMS